PPANRRGALPYGRILLRVRRRSRWTRRSATQGTVAPDSPEEGKVAEHPPDIIPNSKNSVCPATGPTAAFRPDRALPLAAARIWWLQRAGYRPAGETSMTSQAQPLFSAPPFAGNAALIFGGAKGIGRSVAHEWARRGAAIAVA